MLMNPVDTTLMLIQRRTGRALSPAVSAEVKTALQSVYDAGKAGTVSEVSPAAIVAAKSGREINARDLAEVEKLVGDLFAQGEASAPAEVPAQ
jgi:hypothetical protein